MPVIKVEMLEGRPIEKKRELAEALTREFARICELDPALVNVVIDEYPKTNWAVGGQLIADRTAPK